MTIFAESSDSTDLDRILKVQCTGVTFLWNVFLQKLDTPNGCTLIIMAVYANIEYELSSDKLEKVIKGCTMLNVHAL